MANKDTPPRHRPALKITLGEGKTLTLRHAFNATLFILCLAAVSGTGLVYLAMTYGEKPAEQGSSSN